MLNQTHTLTLPKESNRKAKGYGHEPYVHHENPNEEFGADVKKGLTSFPKTISHRWFYDGEGSRLFQEVMAAEEYYLTDCEYEIFETQKANILDALPASFDLIDLGAGDGLKTKILLRHLLEKKTDFTYMPLDISKEILTVLTDSLKEEMPELQVKPLHNDYFGGLKKIANFTDRPKVVIFLGANIGNFNVEDSEFFLNKLRASLQKGDMLLLGLDLVKDPRVLLAAYDDKAGAFERFCYHVMTRINKDLGANFDITKFAYHVNYPPQTNIMNMNLVSREKQTVWIEALQLEVPFEAWEGVRVTFSQKYTLQEIARLAKNSHFKVNKHFYDKREYFVDVLWEAI